MYNCIPGMSNFGSCLLPGKAFPVRFLASPTQLVSIPMGSSPGRACSTLMGGPRPLKEGNPPLLASSYYSS